MKSVLELKEDREFLEAQMTALVETAESDNRDLTDDDVIKFNDLEVKVKALNERISVAERAAKIRLAKDKVVKAPEAKVRERYSITRAIKQYVATNGRLDGVELEMDQEAKRINPMINGIGIPSIIGDTRAGELTAGTAGSAGNAIETELDPSVIDSLQPTPKIIGLGAELKRGLVGDYEILRNTTAATAVWEGEIDANAVTTPVYDKLALSPNRLGAYVEFSKQLMVQNTRVADTDLIRLIRQATERLLDATMIDGDTGGTDPFNGILSTAGIGNVALDTNGLAPTWASIVALESEIFADNAEDENMNYLTTPGMRGFFKSNFKDAGSGLPFMSGSEMNGYGVATSTLVPSNLTKGTNSDCHAIIFGDFASIVLGQWANGYDIVVDPYSGAKTATMNIIVNSWYDMVIKHAESFAAILDARNI